jgi:hypothetical protein
MLNNSGKMEGSSSSSDNSVWSLPWATGGWPAATPAPNAHIKTPATVHRIGFNMIVPFSKKPASHPPLLCGAAERESTASDCRQSGTTRQLGL